MSRFQTLLQREWMQHHRGWLILMCTPPILALLLVAFAPTVDVHPASPMALLLACTLGGSVLVLGITVVAVVMSAAGLARRDQQDRSIEFWLSLPVGHTASIAATVLMHAVAMPLLALGIGYAFSQIIGLVLVSRANGIGGVLGLEWGVVLSTSPMILARALLGVLLASVWLMPFVLLPMAASAWLKRWGTAALVPLLGVAHLVLSRVYGIRWIGETVHGLLQAAARAMVHAVPETWRQGPGSESWVDSWPVTPAWLVHDGLAAIGDLWQPLLLVSLAISAACFALLVLRRRQSA